MTAEIASKWAAQMTTSGFFTGPESIGRAWFLSAREEYARGRGIPEGTTIILRVAGWPNCLDDKLLLYASPGTTDASEITFRDYQAYPTIDPP